ncbi:MAG: type II CRISPR-associated endonuclease Cas1 [Rhodanobacteraceae bacterium]
MIGRIVEIASDGRHLALQRGFLVVKHKGEEVGRTPIDDIAALIGNAHGLSYSNNLLVGLAERGCPFVLCGSHHRPVGMLWPVDNHHRQAARMDAQLRAPLPLRTRLWKQIVRGKISMQAAALEVLALHSAPVRRMVARVRAGDVSNVEGQAARVYWNLLFGGKFRRDRSGEGINSLLNYGYTVLRAMVARHLIAAGLHPGIPIHHANEGNPMRLVDDLMEPFRPLADLWVRKLVDQRIDEVTPDAKRTLGLLPTRNLLTEFGISPLSVVVERCCVSLAQIYQGSRKELTLPDADVDAIRTVLDERESSEEDGEQGK